jgi:hypothetical protein
VHVGEDGRNGANLPGGWLSGGRVKLLDKNLADAIIGREDGGLRPVRLESSLCRASETLLLVNVPQSAQSASTLSRCPVNSNEPPHNFGAGWTACATITASLASSSAVEYLRCPS